MDFLNSWPVMIGLVVALVALVGIMLFLRSNKKDED